MQRKTEHVTIKKIARAAGVSVATVSYALNNSPKISEETRQKVLEIAKKLKYRPSSLGRSLRDRQSRIIGYSWLHLPNNYWHPILDPFLHSIAQSAEANGYHILTFTQPSMEMPWSPYEELILSQRVDGFIVSETEQNDPRIRYLIDSGFPFVAFGRSNPEWDFPYVDVNNVYGAYLAVKHLVELGHQQIAFIGWKEETFPLLDRLQGYKQALQEPGLPINPKWIIRTDYTEEASRNAIKRLLLLPENERPTAVFALSDILAIGALNALHESGLQVGKDFSVVGYDDVPMAQYLYPPLTTVRQPIIEIGQCVVEMLLGLIQRENLERRTVILPPKLIVRASTGNPRDTHL